MSMRQPDADLEAAAGSSDTAHESAAGPERGGSSRSQRVVSLLSRLRKPRTLGTKVLLAALVVLLLGAGVGSYYSWSSSGLPEGAAFRVGDEMVTVEELEKDMDTLRALYGVQRPEAAERLDGFWRDAAKSQVVTRILERAASERDIVIAEKNARDALSRYIAAQIGTGPAAYDQFVQALGSAGTTEQAVLDELRRQLALNQLFDQVTSGQTVSDAELRGAFEEHAEQLGTPERRRIRNIVVRTQAEARRVLAEIDSGISFAQVARRRSLDGSTRGKGGDLGVVSREELEATYAARAFGARPGAVYGPLRNAFGWNVGFVERVLPPVPARFEEARSALKDVLLVEKATAAWRSWLGEQIRSADVEYADEYRPDDPDAPPGDSYPDGQGLLRAPR
jgi:peptidyl-prolyl cis-trans isomerase C